MDPFDRHPASASELGQWERQYTDLANETVDVEKVTRNSFDPAVASWDGIAAPELQAAPKPVRAQAYKVASHLTWTATATNVWARHVQEFNTIVSRLRGERALVPVEVERFMDSLSTEVMPPDVRDRVREDKHQELVSELNRRWWDAHEEHVEAGSREVSRMFSEGPTWDNLELAHDVGALAVGPSLRQFFATEWEAQAAPAEAVRLAELFNDPNHKPTNEEIEQFHALLKQYADDEAFWYHFLTDLGPEGLLTVNGNLALHQPDPHVAWDPLAEMIGDIQVLLGGGLALAATQRGTGGGHPYAPYYPAENELPPDWLTELSTAGRQQYEVGPNGAPVYGYQLLGPLLQTGEYDSRFLQVVGGGMIDFEMAEGGSGFWFEEVGLGSNRFQQRLDWTSDGVRTSAGFDPMDGLMSAMRRNPEGALDLLHGRREYGVGTWADGTPKDAEELGLGIEMPPGIDYRLPRLDYLLTDREWPVDWVNSGGRYNNPLPDNLDLIENRPALREFGNVLVEVSRLDDQRAVEVVGLMVYEINTDERAMGYPNGDVPGKGSTVDPVGHNIVTPVLREAVGTVMAEYVVDVNQSIHESRIPTSLGARGADFDQEHVVRLLADLGKDQDVHEAITTAQMVYTIDAYDTYLSADGGEFDPDGDRRLADVGVVAEQAGAVMGALDAGAAESEWYEILRRDATRNAQLEDDFAIARHLVGGVGELVGTPAPGLGYAVTQAGNAVVDEFMDSMSLDNRGQAHYVMTSIMSDGRDGAAQVMKAALIHSGNLPDFPEGLAGIPVSDWGPDEEEAWEDYIDFGDTPGEPENADQLATIGPAVSDAAKAYGDGFKAARGILGLPAN